MEREWRKLMENDSRTLRQHVKQKPEDDDDDQKP